MTKCLSYVLSIPSDHCFNNRFIPYVDFLNTCYFILIKVKADHIPFILMVVIQIIRKLLLASLIILIPIPDLKLYDKLFTGIIHNHIRSSGIPDLGFNVIITDNLLPTKINYTDASRKYDFLLRDYLLNFVIDLVNYFHGRILTFQMIQQSFLRKPLQMTVHQ